MVTVAAIIARVENRVIDLPSHVQSEVQNLVAARHRELQELHSFKVMERLATATTVVDTNALGAVPSDLKDYHDQPFYTDDLGHTDFLTIMHSRAEVLRAIATGPSDTGPPIVLLDEEGEGSASRTWAVFPTPDGLAITASGEYTVQIPYYAYLPFPTSSDWFTDTAAEFLVNAATAEAFALNWDEARYALWRSKAYGPLWDQRRIMGGELKTVVQRDQRFKVSAVDTLVPYDGARRPKVRLT